MAAGSPQSRRTDGGARRSRSLKQVMGHVRRNKAEYSAPAGVGSTSTGHVAVTESFAVLAEAACKVLARCPWTTARTVEQFAAEIRGEADELLLAVANRDHENLKEELGDLLFDTVVCALLAERSGHFKAHEVVDQVVAKMQRRKPFVFDGTRVTEEEAKRIWAAAKAREKRAR